jgi:hypothetical protein
MSPSLNKFKLKSKSKHHPSKPLSRRRKRRRERESQKKRSRSTDQSRNRIMRPLTRCKLIHTNHPQLSNMKPKRKASTTMLARQAMMRITKRGKRLLSRSQPGTLVQTWVISSPASTVMETNHPKRT